MGQRVSAKFCGFLRFSVKTCGFLLKSAPPKCCNSQKSENHKKSGKICEKLRIRLRLSHFQKNPRVRKNSCPQFWARKWVRQFYGRLEKCVLSAGKTHFFHKIPLFGRGGGNLVLGGGGGGSADFIFMGARIFSDICPKDPTILKYYGVVIYYRRSNSRLTQISCDIFPAKQGVSETLP